MPLFIVVETNAPKTRFASSNEKRMSEEPGYMNTGMTFSHLFFAVPLLSSQFPNGSDVGHFLNFSTVAWLDATLLFYE
jgi:hypothetical protein